MSWNEITVLVERAKLGDREAYGELVVRFQASVFATAMTKMRNEVDAQELAQDVFIHGMRKLPQLREARAFGGWLRRITVRMALNRLTRRGIVSGTEQEILDSAPSRTSGPVEELERSEARAELREGLNHLKPLDRETLEAFYIRGRSLKQMSREFDTPVGTIKRRLFVARQRLKDVLEAANTPSNAGAFAREETLTRRKRELATAV